MTKLADRRPPFCACCFQRPQGRCVDFEAAYDGPVIPGTPEPVPVDDLIICEDCLAEAFTILDPQGLKETIAELEQIVTDQVAELEAKDKAIQGFRSTTNVLVDHPVKTFPGKPKLEGVSEEVRTMITKRRYERTARSKAVKAGEKGKSGEKSEVSNKEPVAA